MYETDFSYLNYGTPDSDLLDAVIQAGFKPIGITVLMCEETFIFKSKQEAEEAAEIFLPEGWWYDIGSWVETRQQYIDDIYEGDTELAPKIHWLDKNYEFIDKNI